MHVLIPVKSFADAKLRLRHVLSPGQRRKLSRLMLEDMLACLIKSSTVSSISIISCEEEVSTIAEQFGVNVIPTENDQGYSEDATLGIARLSNDQDAPVAILPADLPQISVDDVEQLCSIHKQGITLCPAALDGGTNALIIDAGLKLELVFGDNSLQRYQELARRLNIPQQTVSIPGMERDLDRPEDLNWLKNQAASGKTWAYLRAIEFSHETEDVCKEL